ncbi:hypothetical protein VE03_00175 [Pseudogymnoascus sp. 23342-1-I1]|nr:hypothetical protein VE03_00175 [Pseudogymnoascus sp. 23342-1-I1]
MFARPAHRATTSLLTTTTTPTLTRALHARIPPPPIPQPTPFVPDAPTFLSLIGRNLSQHASKIPTWESLFRLTSPQLRDLGVEPARARRYLLAWRERFRRGEYGPGGDARVVEEGVVRLRVVEVEGGAAEGTATRTGGMKRVVVNGGEEIEGVRVKGAQRVVGAHVLPVKGGTAQIKATEGLWEVRRGRKIDGGERRKAEVRSKRRAAERKEARK